MSETNDKKGKEPIAGYDPTARNFQRTDNESDVDPHDKIENQNKMEEKHQSDDLGSSGKEEKDITV